MDQVLTQQPPIEVIVHYQHASSQNTFTAKAVAKRPNSKQTLQMPAKLLAMRVELFQQAS
jgi:hypothetical protein